MKRRPRSLHFARLALLLSLLLGGSGGLVGCGGDSDKGAPKLVGEDPAAAKRDQEMKDFMEKKAQQPAK